MNRRKGETRKIPSEYRAMWLLAMFDLPVDTQQHRREYAQFRKHLLKEGFVQLQYSVYARFAASDESVEATRQRVRTAIPPHGHVRLMAVTDRQYARMEVYFGKKRKPVEDPPAQYELF